MKKKKGSFETTNDEMIDDHPALEQGLDDTVEVPESTDDIEVTDEEFSDADEDISEDIDFEDEDEGPL